ncbi:MAG: bL34 family ribosomal protein [Patescibacteria group bacterium]
MPKRTHQPNKRHRAKTHGFLLRSATVLLNRRRKGRRLLAKG